jgi:progressive ankylosis protein
MDIRVVDIIDNQHPYRSSPSTSQRCHYLEFAKDRDSSSANVNLGRLWREFLPLSLSDVMMACGDPLVTTTLAHLPNARSNIAGVGIAKTLAIFFESPIIMMLHASNAVAANDRSRAVLWRFMLIAGGGLSLLLALLGVPLIFDVVGTKFLGIPPVLITSVREVLWLMILWPFSIAWRRYFQGLLIHSGNSRSIAQAGIVRLLAMAIVLAIGVALNLSGSILAGLSLIIGVIIEAILITIAAYRCGATLSTPERSTDSNLPQDLSSMWRFYWPLANSMLVAWGGRALLVGVIARAGDGQIALAAWPAAWGLVIVIANSTRMVQQIIIKYQGRVADRLLLNFALSVGMACSILLLLISTTPIGDTIVQSFIGSDRLLVDRIEPVLLICSIVPLLIAIQNATQGFLVSGGKTGSVNIATWLGTIALLGSAWLAVGMGVSGAIAAAIAMVVSMAIEVSLLVLQRRFS